MYDNHKICPDLDVGSRCFVLELNNSGKVERKLHQHIDKRRMGREAVVSAVRGLVARYYYGSGMSGEMILAAHCNSRGGSPSKDPALDVRCAFIEPGVKRLYCGKDTIAWVDEVVSPSSFRSGQGEG